MVLLVLVWFVKHTTARSAISFILQKFVVDHFYNVFALLGPCIKLGKHYFVINFSTFQQLLLAYFGMSLVNSTYIEFCKHRSKRFHIPKMKLQERKYSENCYKNHVKN